MMSPWAGRGPTAGALLGAAAVVVIAALVATTVQGAPSRSTTQTSTDLELALVEQQFVVAPRGTFHLEYSVTGELAAELTTTTTTSTTTTTTTTTTTLPPLGAPAPATTPQTAQPPTETTSATSLPDDESTIVEDATEVVVTAYEPIRLRSDVASVLDGRLPDAVDSARYDIQALIVAGATTRTATLALDVTTAISGEVERELELPTAGLYPITVEVRRDGRRLDRHITFVERLRTTTTSEPARPPMMLSVVGGIQDPGPEPDELELLDGRARLLEAAQLGELIEAPLTLAIPPVLAARLDEDDPELAERVRTALAGDETVALPDIALDPSSAVAAGEVKTFTDALRRGEDLLTTELPATATRRTAWLAASPLSSDGAAMLRDLGTRLVIEPFAEYASQEGSIPELTDTSMLVLGALPDGGTINIAIVDEVNALLDPDRTPDGTPAENAVELYATLAAMRTQLGPGDRTIVLSTPTLGLPDADVLSHVEAFASDDPAVGFQALSFVPGSTDVMEVFDQPLVVQFDANAGPDLTQRSAQTDRAQLVVASTESMLPVDDPRPDEWNAELAVVLSTAISQDEATARIDAVLAENAAVQDDVIAPDPFAFTLTGRASEIRLRIGNDGPTPLRIRVHASSDKLTFPEGDREVDLAPNAITEVEIPVESRSNGTFPVQIELFTPAGQALVDPIPLTARVNALTGLGQLITGAAALVLASWWFSHFRSRRKERLARVTSDARNGHPSNGHRRKARRAADAPAAQEAADADVSPDAATAAASNVSPDAAAAASNVSPDAAAAAGSNVVDQ